MTSWKTRLQLCLSTDLKKAPNIPVQHETATTMLICFKGDAALSGLKKKERHKGEGELGGQDDTLILAGAARLTFPNLLLLLRFKMQTEKVRTRCGQKSRRHLQLINQPTNFNSNPMLPDSNLPKPRWSECRRFHSEQKGLHQSPQRCSGSPVFIHERKIYNGYYRVLDVQFTGNRSQISQRCDGVVLQSDERL